MPFWQDVSPLSAGLIQEPYVPFKCQPDVCLCSIGRCSCFPQRSAQARWCGRQASSALGRHLSTPLSATRLRPELAAGATYVKVFTGVV